MHTARSLDHFVLTVSDLDRAAGTYKRLGFNVRPIARHIKLGSANCVVHFRRTYLELAHLGTSQVGVPYQARLDLGDGLAHVSLTSDDLQSDRQRLIDEGFTPDEIYSASRKVVMPDGQENETASDFFYCWRPESMYLSLFFSEHKKPETIFIPEYEDHPNTAIDTVRLVYMSENPQMDEAHFRSFFGSEPEATSENGFIMRGARGDLTEVLTISAAQKRYGSHLLAQTPSPLNGFGVAMHYRVADLNTCRKALAENGVSTHEHDGGVLVPAGEAAGCVVVFDEDA